MEGKEGVIQQVVRARRKSKESITRTPYACSSGSGYASIAGLSRNALALPSPGKRKLRSPNVDPSSPSSSSPATARYGVSVGVGSGMASMAASSSSREAEVAVARQHGMTERTHAQKEPGVTLAHQDLITAEGEIDTELVMTPRNGSQDSKAFSEGFGVGGDSTAGAAQSCSSGACLSRGAVPAVSGLTNGAAGSGLKKDWAVNSNEENGRGMDHPGATPSPALGEIEAEHTPKEQQRTTHWPNQDGSSISFPASFPESLPKLPAHRSRIEALGICISIPEDMEEKDGDETGDGESHGGRGQGGSEESSLAASCNLRVGTPRGLGHKSNGGEMSPISPAGSPRFVMSGLRGDVDSCILSDEEDPTWSMLNMAGGYSDTEEDEHADDDSNTPSVEVSTRLTFSPTTTGNSNTPLSPYQFSAAGGGRNGSASTAATSGSNVGSEMSEGRDHREEKEKGEKEEAGGYGEGDCDMSMMSECSDMGVGGLGLRLSEGGCEAAQPYRAPVSPCKANVADASPEKNTTPFDAMLPSSPVKGQAGQMGQGSSPDHKGFTSFETVLSRNSPEHRGLTSFDMTLQGTPAKFGDVSALTPPPCAFQLPLPRGAAASDGSRPISGAFAAPHPFELPSTPNHGNHGNHGNCGTGLDVTADLGKWSPGSNRKRNPSLPLPDQEAFDCSRAMMSGAQAPAGLDRSGAFSLSSTGSFSLSATTPNSSFVPPPTPARTPSWAAHAQLRGGAALNRRSSLHACKVLATSPSQKQGAESGPVDFSKMFINLGKIGEGAFAEVFKVHSRLDGRLHAVKKSKRQMRSKRERERSMQEVLLLKQLGSSPYIVHFERAWQEGGYFYSQTELCELGNVKDLIWRLQDKSSVPPSTVVRILHDVTEGLNHMHLAGLVHLDIKPSNIFVCKSGRLKIGDFGMATAFGDGGSGEEGDTLYMAKELLETDARLPSADMFSLGITVYEIASGIVLPGEGEGWHDLRDGRVPPLPQRFGRDLNRLVLSLMTPQPQDRPSAAELLADPLVKVGDPTELDPFLALANAATKNRLLAGGSALGNRSVSYEPLMEADEEDAGEHWLPSCMRQHHIYARQMLATALQWVLSLSAPGLLSSRYWMHFCPHKQALAPPSPLLLVIRVQHSPWLGIIESNMKQLNASRLYT
ncbi:unnamed protein product [Chrysoparadoxa australica]